MSFIGVLDRTPRGGTWGDIGARFGSGLGQGLSELAQHKLNQRMENNLIKQAGLNDQEAALWRLGRLGGGGNDILKAITSTEGWGNTQQRELQNMLQGQQGFTPMGGFQNTGNPLQSQISGIPSINQPQLQALQALTAAGFGHPGMQQQKQLSNVLEEESAQAEPLRRLINQSLSQGQREQLFQQNKPFTQFQQPAQALYGLPQQPAGNRPLTSTQQAQPQQRISPPPVVPESYMREQPKGNKALNYGKNPKAEEVELKKEELQDKRSSEVRKYLEPYNKQQEAAEKDIRDYKALEKLAETGKIRSGNAHVLLSKLGLEGFNRNLTTELADKLMGRLMQNAGAAFGTGTRLTNFLESTFQKSIPSLWNTNQGIKTISQMNSLGSEAIKLQTQERKNIIRENGGRIPADIDDLVKERLQPELDRLENMTINIAASANSPVTKTFNSLPSASLYPPNPETGKQQRLRTPDGKILFSDGKTWREQ